VLLHGDRRLKVESKGERYCSKANHNKQQTWQPKERWCPRCGQQHKRRDREKESRRFWKKLHLKNFGWLRAMLWTHKHYVLQPSFLPTVNCKDTVHHRKTRKTAES